MLSLFTGKKEKPFEKIARDAFSYKNEFWNVIDSFTDRQKQSKIEKALIQMQNNKGLEVQIYLSSGEYKGHHLRINQSTVDTFDKIGRGFKQIRKIQDRCERADTDYLYNLLVDVVHLMVQIDDSLKKGIPLHHNTIQEAATLIQVTVHERLDDYYRMSAAELTAEINVAKDMRKTYEARRNALKTTTKIETGA